MNKTKHFAVFGDTHGHLRLMFQLCRLWQVTHQDKLDGIFQCGDLGYFPNPDNLDKATRRYAKEDPEELGFKYFGKPEPILKDNKLNNILCGPEADFNTVRAPVYFCHGNHEDFQSLSREVAETTVKSIDCFDRLSWLKPGYVHNSKGIKIAALGGGTELPDTPDDDYGLDEPWKWVNYKACEKLINSKFHILLSHTSPKGIGGASDWWGSERLRLVVELCQPHYHFFSHHNDPIPQANIGNTKCYWLNDVNFSKNQNGMDSPLEKGSMGILSWTDENSHEFKIIDESWMAHITFDNWWKR